MCHMFCDAKESTSAYIFLWVPDPQNCSSMNCLTTRFFPLLNKACGFSSFDMCEQEGTKNKNRWYCLNHLECLEKNVNILIDSNVIIGLVVFYILSTYRNCLEESKLLKCFIPPSKNQYSKEINFFQALGKNIIFNK